MIQLSPPSPALTPAKVQGTVLMTLSVVWVAGESVMYAGQP